MNTLEAATAYAARGWPVVFLHSLDSDGYCLCNRRKQCEFNVRGKHPLMGRGKKDATTDQGTIVQVVQNHDVNLGVVTGSHSGFVVLDVDPRNGGSQALGKLIADHSPFPPTLCCDTGGGGIHFYFKHPGVPVRTGISFLGAGLDIKGDTKDGKAGGYVVAPPSKHTSGNSYKWRNHSVPFRDDVLADVPVWLLPLITYQETSHIDDQYQEHEDIPEGQRHSYLVSRAGKMHQGGFSGSAIQQALHAENQVKCKPPLPIDEVDRIASDITKYEFRAFRFDDIGNGKRLTSQFQTKIRHCYAQNKWYVWNDKYWHEDDTGRIYEFAKRTIDSIHSEALTRSGDMQAAMQVHAKRSGAAIRVNALVEMARSEVQTAVRVSELDSVRTLLNCPNGTLDLTTGKLYPHQQRDLLTKITTTEYHSTADQTTWRKFLATITNNDQELQQFLQRVCGYALSGLTSEENVFFIYGPGGTGKTTFVEAFKDVLGEGYCKTASFATFLKAGNIAPNAPRGDIARLIGARLVTAIEMAKGRQLAEDLVKASTGGDTIVTRGLYQAEFEFIPQYKLLLASNDKPRVREDDTGLWRRLLLLPFYCVITKPDKKLKDRFRTDKKIKQGILAWAVQGFKGWADHGWTIPSSVRKETQGYRVEMDPLTHWMEDCCELVPTDSEHGFATFASLWDIYEDWLKKQTQPVRNMRIETKKAFGIQLQKRGLEAQTKFLNNKTQRVYKGIQLV